MELEDNWLLLIFDLQGGCDGFIMIEGGEMGVSNNVDVKCLDIINFIKVDMEQMCFSIVFCVDIIVFVGCDVVVYNGGFDI